MSDRLVRTYVLSREVEDMLRRMSTENLRSLSAELELAIRERYARHQPRELVDDTLVYDEVRDDASS